jgi:hypothetical protein
MTFNLIEKDEDTPWQDLLDDILLKSNVKNQRCLGICQTFRNVGEEKIAGNFVVDGKTKG